MAEKFLLPTESWILPEIVISFSSQFNQTQAVAKLILLCYAIKEPGFDLQMVDFSPYLHIPLTPVSSSS